MEYGDEIVKSFPRSRSRLQWSRLACGWKVVELWQLAAEELLAAGDVGLVPWPDRVHQQ